MVDSLTLKYQKLFPGYDAVTHDPITILVEVVDNDVAIQTLEGEFDLPEQFETAVEEFGGTEHVIYNFIPMMRDTAARLKAALEEALEVIE